jgi:hypothetical protein
MQEIPSIKLKHTSIAERRSSHAHCQCPPPQVLANSGAGFKIQAAALQYTSWAEPAGGHVAALNALDAGQVTGIAAARNLYKADLVQLVINNEEYCGYASDTYIYIYMFMHFSCRTKSYTK